MRYRHIPFVQRPLVVSNVGTCRSILCPHWHRRHYSFHSSMSENRLRRRHARRTTLTRMPLVYQTQSNSSCATATATSVVPCQQHYDDGQMRERHPSAPPQMVYLSVALFLLCDRSTPLQPYGDFPTVVPAISLHSGTCVQCQFLSHRALKLVYLPATERLSRPGYDAAVLQLCCFIWTHDDNVNAEARAMPRTNVRPDHCE